MVQIKVKGINNTYHVVAFYEDADIFFELLKERLQHCRDAYTGSFEAFFDVALLCEKDAIRLFQVCEECHTRILGVNVTKHAFTTKIMETSLRGAGEYYFKDALLLLGNVHSNSFVSSEESLYVMGSVQGTIDLLHKECVLCASSVHANIRIGDASFQNMTYFSPCKVYYEDRKLVIEKYKEELLWEKL